MTRLEEMGGMPRRCPAVLDGELWGIATYFNPAEYPNKIENLKCFSASVRRQGLKLLIVELAFDNQGFVLDDCIADTLIQLKASTVLWQKERLLNVGLDHLPDTCDKVAWLDTDILFDNDAWVRDTKMLLNEFVVIQPYDVAWWLAPGVRAIPRTMSADTFVLAKHGLAYTQAQAPYLRELCGHFGFAWAARRSLLRQHGFYDRLILGSGDFALCWGMYGDWLDFPGKHMVDQIYTHAQIEDLIQWKDCFHNDVRSSVFFVEGRVFHLWHGTGRDRQYIPRLKMVKAADFDPKSDIAIDSNGCWKWNSDKPNLHRQVREYFWQRNEELRVHAGQQGHEHLA